MVNAILMQLRDTAVIMGVIALVGLSLWYSAPSPYSFLPAGSVPGTALAAVCYFFLAVSTLAR